MSKRNRAEHSYRQFDIPACGALARPNGSVCWRVWAPAARSVELVLYEPGPTGKSRALSAEVEPDGYFTCQQADVVEGQLYAWRLDGGPARPDPASRWQPDGVHRPSSVVQLDRFEWSEGDWPGLRREQLVIYELHVGTFTSEGTLD